MFVLQYLTLTFAALAIATSSHHGKVTADTIVADIQDIQAKTAILRQTVEPYQGGRGTLGQALDINHAADDVTDAIENAIDDAEDVAPLTEDEALNIGAAVIDLNPEVINTLEIFKQKRAAFDNHYKLSPIVLKTLKKQRGLTQELTDKIRAKVPDDLKDLATDISRPAIEKFDEVIAVYAAK